jgi:PAS domain-containing protein
MRGMSERERAKRITEALAALRTRVGIRDSLATRGVRSADIPELAGHAVKDACIVTNPRYATWPTYRRSMAKPSEINDWEAKRAGIVGLGERSFHKSYYPQLRQNIERLERFHTLLDQTTDFVILVALPDGTVTDANAALGRLLGEPAKDLIGRPFAELGLGDACLC